jgi:predicted nucleic acid-binding protein
MSVAATDAFVLDASATAAWLLPDEHSEAADRAYTCLRASTVDAHAPEGWLWECGNIIANGVRTGRVDSADALLMWSVLDAVRTRVELSTLEPPQVRACLVLAMDHGLTIHAAAYLWLAKSLGLPLLTHDESLARACSKQKVPVLRLEDFA